MTQETKGDKVVESEAKPVEPPKVEEAKTLSPK